ncbi:MAG: hypothetical protein JJT82_02225 [Legionellaceae bacterium]|nr:hypothetical protein [Legionellaceae bacterium]
MPLSITELQHRVQALLDKQDLPKSMHYLLSPSHGKWLQYNLFDRTKYSHYHLYQLKWIGQLMQAEKEEIASANRIKKMLSAVDHVTVNYEDTTSKFNEEYANFQHSGELLDQLIERSLQPSGNDEDKKNYYSLLCAVDLGLRSNILTSIRAAENLLLAMEKDASDREQDHEKVEQFITQLETLLKTTLPQFLTDNDFIRPSPQNQDTPVEEAENEHSEAQDDVSSQDSIQIRNQLNQSLRDSWENMQQRKKPRRTVLSIFDLKPTNPTENDSNRMNAPTKASNTDLRQTWECVQSKLRAKQQDLLARRQIKAAEAVQTLIISLDQAIEAYASKTCDAEGFKTKANEAITDAHATLDQHRGWAAVLHDLAFWVVSVLTVGTINLTRKCMGQSPRFFEPPATASQQLLDEVQDTLVAPAS